jgi:YfiH family protein
MHYDAKFIHHHAIPVPHGFFERSGGVSCGEFLSLNGGGTRDLPSLISENRKRALIHLEILKNGPIFFPKQVHGAHVWSLSHDSVFAAYQEADAVVSAQRGHTLGILTADCAPVFFYHPKGIIGAAHAGWRGAISGILENTIHVMKEWGACVDQLVAVIGPTISGDSYQVGEDFFEQIEHSSPFCIDNFFTRSSKKLFFNLPAYIKTRLLRHMKCVYDVQRDTFGDIFFSRRYALSRGQQRYGLSMSIISLA